MIKQCSSVLPIMNGDSHIDYNSIVIYSTMTCIKIQMMYNDLEKCIKTRTVCRSRLQCSVCHLCNLIKGLFDLLLEVQ